MTLPMVVDVTAPAVVVSVTLPAVVVSSDRAGRGGVGHGRRRWSSRSWCRRSWSMMVPAQVSSVIEGTGRLAEPV